MNRIYIRDVVAKCIIGTEPRERVEPQSILINIRLECDFAAACHSDSLDETVDYKALKTELVAFTEKSSCFLLEKLASELADICLKQELVQGVAICIDKPGALTGARSVAVEVERMRS